MLKLLFRRLLLIIPVSILIAISVFFLSSIVPGDRVSDYLDLFGTTSGDKTVPVRDYIKTAGMLNLDKPLFYFSIKPGNYPDSISKIVVPEIKESVLMLAKNEISSAESYKTGKELTELKIAIEDLNNVDKNRLTGYFTNLVKSSNYQEFLKELQKLKTELTEFPAIISEIEKIESQLHNKTGTTKTTNLIPEISWHSTDNQFHKWFFNLIKGEFGISIIDGRKVKDKITEALPYTLSFVLLAYLITLLIAIPFGFASVYYMKNLMMRLMETTFSFLYSFPLFWIGTLAVIIFTTNEISQIFNIFPSIGVGFIESDATIFSKLRTAFPHILLPAIIVGLHSAAYLGLLIRRNIEKEMNELYFLSLISKGISHKRALLNHILPNSLIPLITILIIGFPASLAGSVIIEVIFNIPGIGRLLYDSILRFDWAVVFPMVIIIGNLTYIFYVIGDVLYKRMNPKIRYN